MATSSDKKTQKQDEKTPPTPEAQARDLAGPDPSTNKSTRMGHSPRQQFGKLVVEHDADAKTVAFVGADGSRIEVDQSDFDALVAAHKNDQTTADQSPSNR